MVTTPLGNCTFQPPTSCQIEKAVLTSFGFPHFPSFFHFRSIGYRHQKAEVTRQEDLRFPHSGPAFCPPLRCVDKLFHYSSCVRLRSSFGDASSYPPQAIRLVSPLPPSVDPAFPFFLSFLRRPQGTLSVSIAAFSFTPSRISRQFEGRTSGGTGTQRI